MHVTRHPLASELRYNIQKTTVPASSSSSQSKSELSAFSSDSSDVDAENILWCYLW